MLHAEAITKHQKNGNVHQYVYYRCTKKRGPRFEPYVREEVLIAQLSNILSGFVLPPEWAKEMLSLADKDERQAEVAAAASVQSLRKKAADLDDRIRRLTDLYVEQDIERESYLERKRALMSEKRSVEEQTVRLERNAAGWLQPLREWIKDASNLDEIAKTADLPAKKSSLRKIFGSNLSLKNKEIQFVPIKPYAELRSARQNFLKKGMSFTCAQDRTRTCKPLRALPPQGSACTNFATWAGLPYILLSRLTNFWRVLFAERLRR